MMNYWSLLFDLCGLVLNFRKSTFLVARTRRTAWAGGISSLFVSASVFPFWVFLVRSLSLVPRFWIRQSFTDFLRAKSCKVTCFSASVTGQRTILYLRYFKRLLSMTLCCLAPLWNSTFSFISPKYSPSRLQRKNITFQGLPWLLGEFYREQKRRLFDFFSFSRHWWRHNPHKLWRERTDLLIFFYWRTG